MVYNTLMYSRLGFTIVELLIVIVVVAILAAISVVAFTSVQDRARAASVVEGLRQTDQALKLWATEEGFVRWPPETVTSGGFDLEDMTTMEDAPFASFSNYMSRPPSVGGVGDRAWLYDNDESAESYALCSAGAGSGCTGDDKPVCATTNGQRVTGVNIIIRYMPLSQMGLARMVNDAIDGPEDDDDWMSCGKVLFYPDGNQSQIIYTVSRTKMVGASN